MKPWSSTKRSDHTYRGVRFISNSILESLHHFAANLLVSIVSNVMVN